jgi:hypothetical protein
MDSSKSTVDPPRACQTNSAKSLEKWSTLCSSDPGELTTASVAPAPGIWAVEASISRRAAWLGERFHPARNFATMTLFRLVWLSSAWMAKAR